MTADPKLVDYIKSNLKQGFNIQAIKETAMQGGYSSEEFEEAKSEAIPAKPQPVQPSKPVVTERKQESKTPKQEIKPQINQAIPARQISAVPETGLLSKLGRTIISPKKVFSATLAEGLNPAFRYLMVILAVPLAILLALSFLLENEIANTLRLFSDILNTELFNQAALQINAYGPPILGISFLILLFIVIPVITFIISGIEHLFVKLFKGKGEFADTYKAVVYSLTPTAIFFFILPISMIWSIVLCIIGLSEYHEIEKWKAIIIKIITLILVSGLALGIISIASSL